MVSCAQFHSPYRIVQVRFIAVLFMNCNMCLPFISGSGSGGVSLALYQHWNRHAKVKANNVPWKSWAQQYDGSFGRLSMGSSVAIMHNKARKHSLTANKRF